MKILMMHLSDIHFEKKGDISIENVSAMVNALKPIGSFAAAIVIVSGDVAYGGKVFQYNIAYRFFSLLRTKLKEEFDLGDVHFVIVPGNHDVDYDKGKLSHQDLKDIFVQQKQDIVLSEELKKMSAFYNHANGLQCFQDKHSLVWVKELKVADKTVRFNLINTGVYSSLDEDQGMHYLPMSDLQKLENEDKNDYVITVMHHPHHWYHSSMKKGLESKIYEKSDLIYVGHEHYSTSMDVGMNNSQVKIYAGGELANKGNWNNSEFYAGVLETDTREYQVASYKWDVAHKIYISRNEEKTVLSKNRTNKYGFRPTKDYMTDFLQDKKYMISSQFTDYYVFPRLEEIVINEKRLSREPAELEEFLHEIDTYKRVVVLGRNDSGKTLLLKSLFKHMVSTKCVLFVRAQNVKGNYEQTIRNVFEECYSRQHVDYEKFKQIPSDDKVLLLDDADVIEGNLLDDFISRAEKEFGIIVYTCGKLVELDIKERIKRGALEEKYTRYKMQAFYADKRKQLVANIVKILVKQDIQAQENIIELLCEALAKQKNLFRMDPDFVVQFTKYYCNNIGETIQNDGEVFSKVFESNIVSLIKPFAKHISVDKILIIMDKIAYEMHCTKNYPMNQSDICDIIAKYNEEFDSEVDYVEFLSILIESNIFVKSKTDYYFSEKNYLAYFVAREIKRRCLEEQDYSEYNKALEFSCYGINADILLFVTYITDNLNLIRMIMDKADEYTEDWEEFSINPITIPYLSDVDQLKVDTVGEDDKAKAEEAEIQKEKQIDHEKETEVISGNLYNYDETEELTFMKKLIRGLSLLAIISRTLPSFEHMMKKADKEKCVRLIYSLPLKIFNVWALGVEECKIELIDELKNLTEWDYRKDAPKLDDNSVLNFLRWESISLLMEMMNSSIGNATKPNTYKFLDSFDYYSKDLYRIEHLMGLDKRDVVSDFIDEAEAIFVSQRQQLPKLMVQRVTKHFIIRSKRIQRGDIQRLSAKLWDGKLNRPALLLKKNRDTKKEQ